MESIDTTKLRDILDMMKDTGAVFLKHGELIIEFNRVPTDEAETTAVVGFEASGTDTQEPEAKQVKMVPASGYTALFGDKTPRFPTPGS